MKINLSYKINLRIKDQNGQKECGHHCLSGRYILNLIRLKYCIFEITLA